MKAPVSWLRDFVDLPEEAPAVAAALGSRGFAVEGIEGETIDVEVTANRPDALSVYGLAREAAVAFDRPLRPLPALAPAAAGPAPVKVSIADAGCGRYALAVADVTVGPSPDWLAERLTAAGVRPINNVVDVTNYVMLELGHPMHAFDLATLGGPEIHVRRARAGETIVTIDNETRALDETMLVIADRTQPVAVAGVMGGAATEVSSRTSRVALESAWFLPSTVRATSRRLGLKTEASARFERGADLAAPVVALRRALQLLADVGAGRLAGGLTDVAPRTPETPNITLRRERIARLLGAAVPDADVERILGGLGFQTARTPAGWHVGVPSFRVDIARESDLIEEVGRHWGFDRIPATFPTLRSAPRPSSPGVARGRLVRRLLCGAGLQEAVTFTFIEAAAAAPFAGAAGVVPITNPLSEKFAVLRPSLGPGLVESLQYNRNRQAADVRLFEIGSVFSPAREWTAVGWVLTGSRGAHWSGSAGDVSFADARGLAELIAEGFGATVACDAAGAPSWLAGGERASLVSAGVVVGWIGRLAGTRDAPVYAGEIDLDALPAAPARPAPIAPLARFPSVVRDLSILVSDRLPAADVRGTIQASAPPTLVDIREFDRYRGKGVPEGHVSLAIRLTFRDPDRTLTDAEVQQAIDVVVEALGRTHGAVLRGA
jgi:phenylalanyl-tRNA synthetase beta chain